MNLCVIAARGLHCGRQLDRVDIAGLHFCLDEEMQNAGEGFLEESENADFGLIDDGLRPMFDGPEIRRDLDALDTKELAGLVPEVSGLFLAVRQKFHLF